MLSRQAVYVLGIYDRAKPGGSPSCGVPFSGHSILREARSMDWGGRVIAQTDFMARVS